MTPALQRPDAPAADAKRVRASSRWSRRYRVGTELTHHQLLRFLLLGGMNTLVGAAALYVLSGFMPATVAWTVTYAVGITFVMLVTPGFVFGSNARVSRRLLLGGWYVCTYLVGLGVIALLDSVASAPRIVVVLITVAVTAPLGFIGSRLLVGAAAGARVCDSPVSGSRRQ